MESNKSMVDGELHQEGCTRVQYFSSPAVPVLPGAPLEPRRGRPSRPPSENRQGVPQSVNGPAVARIEAVEQIKSQISTLSAAERAYLAYFLLASLEPEEAGTKEAWQMEIARRVTEIRSGQAVGRPIDDVLAELRERYLSAHSPERSS